MESGGVGEVEDGDVGREHGIGLVLEGLHDPGAVAHGDRLVGGHAAVAGAAVGDGVVERVLEEVELVLDL